MTHPPEIRCAQERFATVAGRRMRYLTAGSGPPLVLLHSSAEFAAIWLRVVPDLVGGHRVIIPDLPGHGASAAPATP